jgi:anti-anti-sigma regulatory factor
MRTRPSQERIVLAPEELGLDSRTQFRSDAFARLEGIPKGGGRLVIDVSSTQSVDSTGLGALIMVQRRAAQRRIPVLLRGANKELCFLLSLTKLEGLFELESVEE